MKKISHLFFITLLLSFIIPSLALASWWNPFSWFKNKTLKTKSNIEITTPILATTTLKTAGVDLNVKDKIDSQLKAALKDKEDEDKRASQQKIDTQAKIDIAVKAALDKQKAEQDAVNFASQQAAQNAANIAAQQKVEQDAANFAAQQAAQNLAAQQRAAQEESNNAAVQAQNVKQAKLNAINLQITNLNSKYNIDLQNVTKQAIPMSFVIGQQAAITRQYEFDYNSLVTQYQQIQLSN